MRDFVTGNVNSYSIIMNYEKSMKNSKTNNDLSVGLEMLNAQKAVKTKETAAKKVLEATDKDRKKTCKDTE